MTLIKKKEPAAPSSDNRSAGVRFSLLNNQYVRAAIARQLIALRIPPSKIDQRLYLWLRKFVVEEKNGKKYSLSDYKIIQICNKLNIRLTLKIEYDHEQTFVYNKRTSKRNAKKLPGNTRRAKISGIASITEN